MQKNIFIIFVTMMLHVMPNAARAGEYAAWGFSDAGLTGESASSFVINTGSTSHRNNAANAKTTQATITGMVATRVFEHGAYFCPTEIECASKNDISKDNVWLNWRKASVTDNSGTSLHKCLLVCEEGYSGNDCEVYTGTQPDKCDMDNYVTMYDAAKIGSGFSNQDIVSLGRSHKSPDGHIVIGVTKFLEHGVVAAPIRIECARRDNKKTSFKEILRADGIERILCAEGYKPSGDKCVPVGDCEALNATWCDGFSAATYDDTMHKMVTFSKTIEKKSKLGKKIKTREVTCQKHFCKEYNYGFASDNSFECIECGGNMRSGVHTETGVCIQCDPGQVFRDNDCINTTGYSKTDMAYGKNKTKSTPVNALTDQCWTKFMPDDYAQCVKNSR